VSAFEVLRRPGGRVARALVIGGGVLGVGVAHLLAERGIDVVLAEAGGTLAAELGVRPRWQYVAGLRERSNVAVHLRTTVQSLGGDRAALACGDAVVEVAGVDLVVATWPLLPRTELLEALAAVPGGPAVFAIGDCSWPRTAFEAMHEAAALAHRL
jgi:2,4-dienoyl-CoA reductase (NADPH2)